MVGIDSKQGPLDPIFGQHSVFSLGDEGVSVKAIEYLKAVRKEALGTSSFYRSSDRDDDISATGHVADTSDLQQVKHVLEDSISINQWIDELRTDMEPLDEPPSDSLYTEEMLDILVYEIKRYLDEHPEEVNDPVRRVTRSLKPLHNPAYDISPEIVQGVIGKLRNKRFSDVSFLRRYINRPIPVPANFRQWYGLIKHNEPTRQFMLRVPFDELMKLLGYMIQWVNSINKNKPDANQLQQWLLYIWIFMPAELPSPQISQLRDLGKKCQSILQSNRDIETLTLPTELQYTKFPPTNPRLNAIETTLAVMAHRYGQQDLLSVT